MAESSALVFPFAVGLLLGCFFFWGLRWTVGKVLLAPNPGLWIFASLLLRMSITLAGFYFVSMGHWERLTVCLLGFMLARGFVQRSEVKHASDPR